MSYWPTHVVLSQADIERHRAEAHRLAQGVVALCERSSTKPYDIALALYTALAGLCLMHGWHPIDFHAWVEHQFPPRDMVPRSELDGAIDEIHKLRIELKLARGQAS